MMLLPDGRRRNAMRRLPPHDCLICGKEILPRSIKSRKTGLSQGWFTPKKYCSSECQIEANRKGVAAFPVIFCLECGEQIQPRKQFRKDNGLSRGWFQPKKYCSLQCTGMAAHKRQRDKARGRFIDKAGYVILTARKGDDGYQQPEHRAVMEKMIGRKLLDHETVHHKNGIRTDNRPENLELWQGRHGRGQRVEDLQPAIYLSTSNVSLGILSLST